jgi:hypothetical protein
MCRHLIYLIWEANIGNKALGAGVGAQSSQQEVDDEGLRRPCKAIMTVGLRRACGPLGLEGEALDLIIKLIFDSVS